MPRVLVSACVAATLWGGASAHAADDWADRAYVTRAFSDTMPVGAGLAREAVLAALKDDRWVLTANGGCADSVLTEWKSINTPLVRVLIGKITARCLVTVSPLDDVRTIVTIRGAMMTKGDITQSSAFPTAQRAWHRTARKYLRDVRDLLGPSEESATR